MPIFNLVIFGWLKPLAEGKILKSLHMSGKAECPEKQNVPGLE